MRGRGGPHRAPRVRLELRPVTALALSKKPTSQEYSQLLFSNSRKFKYAGSTTPNYLCTIHKLGLPPAGALAAM
jgi:hypothetical protein